MLDYVRTLRRLVMIGAASVLVAACGDSGKQDRAAYEACLGAAKADAKTANAKFEPFEKSTIAGSTGEEEIRVSIPYEQDGKTARYQCIAQKQRDGSFKAIY